ncbi:MAG: thioesterase [Gammaproteobacteria bacterium HGW-Gammaproteobacteria-8]|nr:MAG: thioesterase [Gammaproteobacteria bacterium HGW-Gammaproteobacteria-8]
MTRPNDLLAMYQRFERLPLGKRLFAWMFSRKAPYFGSIRPQIESLQANRCVILLRKRRRVQNHIGTVHVITICNALEMAMGAAAEAGIPPQLRWIPKGMQVDYTARASSDIRAIAEIDPAAWQPGEVPVQVRAERDDGTVVVQGQILLHVSEKPPRPS